MTSTTAHYRKLMPMVSCLMNTSARTSEKTFAKKHPDRKSQAAAGKILIADLVNDEKFSEWIRHLPDETQSGMFDLRMKSLPGLRTYRMPTVTLTGDVPLPAVAKIFETINRTGIRLETFDLMVARLYPEGFKLRDKWDEAQADHPENLGGFGLASGIDILKLVALWAHLDERDKRQTTPEDQKPPPFRVNGVRDSDVLEVDPGYVIAHWNKAVVAYSNAVNFVRDKCGAVRSNLVPSAAMLISLADALREGSPGAAFAKRLEQWFWTSTLHQTYSQGANTRAVSDAIELRAWAISKEAKPEVVKRNLPSRQVLEELFEDQRRRNEVLVRGVLCLVVRRGGRDWIRDEPLSGLEEPIDVHHIFPRDFVEARGWGDSSIVANFAPLTRSTNRKLGKESPSKVVEREDVTNSAIWPHLIDESAFSQDQWRNFLDRRTKELIDAYAEATGKNVRDESLSP